MPKTKKIIVFGTFDIIHPGHENLFKQARKFGSYLIVVVARDKTIKEVKGRLPVNNERARKNNILKLKIADKVILGDLKDKHKAIKKFKPEVICLGYDQKFFVDGLKAPLIRGVGGVKRVKIIRLKSHKPNIYKTSKIIKHKSVGAVVRKDNKILMIDRAIFPFGWACPAGHVDSGETATKALKREVKEETGLEVLKYKLLFHEFVGWNKCSRGVKGHDWLVYEVLEWSGRIKKNVREEKNIKWVDIREIKKLKLEKVWGYWFKKIKFLK
jgi:FAD synthetase